MIRVQTITLIRLALVIKSPNDLVVSMKARVLVIKPPSPAFDAHLLVQRVGGLCLAYVLMLACTFILATFLVVFPLDYR